MLRNTVLFAVIFSFGALIGAAAHSRLRPADDSRYQHRFNIVLEQAKQLQNGLLVIGNSIVERQRLDELCGGALNAGFSRATVGILLRYARAIAASYRPSRIIVSAGVNDVVRKTPIEDFKADYAALVDSLLPAPVVLMDLPDIEGASPYRLVLREVAKARGVPVLDYPVPATLHMPDKVHLTVEGMEIWRAAVEKTICSDTVQRP